MRWSAWRGSVGLFALAGALLVMGGAGAIEVAPDFRSTWNRTDLPVHEGVANRTWMWGPEARSGPMLEPYIDAPGGERMVQYFDKSRMEITDPNADPLSPWYVTNGLLATELITGRMQLGDTEFDQREPARIQVAGDPHSASPSYATFTDLLDRPAGPLGARITSTLEGDGTVGEDASHAAYGVTAAHHVEETGHTVASVFWEFANQTGSVYVDGEERMGTLFPHPFYGIGLPITEAYWISVPVGGERRDVLAQCFERRCLTYTPANPDGWRVEAGNIGQHYYDWRYGDAAGDGTSGSGDPAQSISTGCDEPGQAMLDAVGDSLGNVNRNSWARGTGGDWPAGSGATPSVIPGQEVEFEIAARGECPPLEYRVQRYRPERGVDILRDWSTEHRFSYRFSQDEAGGQVMLIVDLRDGDPRTRFDQRDDYTYLTYLVAP